MENLIESVYKISYQAWRKGGNCLVARPAENEVKAMIFAVQDFCSLSMYWVTRKFNFFLTRDAMLKKRRRRKTTILQIGSHLQSHIANFVPYNVNATQTR